ncbi:Ig-like domain-containing protein [Desulfonema magnum]|nr:Ig-like domain-containing protein [Desulfonema magnum]
MRSNFSVSAVMICVCLFFLSCGGPAEESRITTPGAIDVTADSFSIYPGETTPVRVVVYDTSGRSLSGVQVTLTLDDPTLASITDTVTTSDNGMAEAILTARNYPGEIGVIATAGTVSHDLSDKIIILDEFAPNQIDLKANPSRVIIHETSAVTAQISDADGYPVPDGTEVVFEVQDNLLGSISRASMMTHNGMVTAIFEAADQSGTVTISVSSGTISKATDIVIEPPPAAVIEFLSAEPQMIAVRGRGENETCVVRFIVKDGKNNPLNNVNVRITMTGPNGDEYIRAGADGPADEAEVFTDEEGIAEVTLHSGYVAGPVILTAATDVSGMLMTTQSPMISIGGGVPSAKRLSVASSQLNLAGLEYNNITAEISVCLADRFGNYNVLKGTSVFFASERGLAVNSSEGVSDENGLARVSVRTQGGSAEDVMPFPWELELQDYLQTIYGYDPKDANPRDGLCSVLVYTKGEEHFDDSNGNGVCDPGEIFTDTHEDPFCDYNDDDGYDRQGTGHPEELWFDSGGDGFWDAKNGEWDANKYIFENFQILLTGTPVIYFEKGAENLAIEDGDSREIRVVVCDPNLNQLTRGSEVTIKTDAGILSGEISKQYEDSGISTNLADHLALTEYVFTIHDDKPGDATPDEKATITVQVSWKVSDNLTRSSESSIQIGWNRKPENDTIIPAAVDVRAVSDLLLPGDTTEIYAGVYDESGNPISDAEVIFTLNDPALAFMIGTATTSARGVATVLLTARDYPGEVEITATSESVSSDPPARVVILDASAPDEIRVKASPGSIPVLGMSAVTAEVLNPAGNRVPDGTKVTFETDSGVYGKISPASVTTYAGLATAMFEASDQPGFVKIIAGSGDISGSADIEITEMPAQPVAAMINVTVARDSVYPGETTEIYAAAYDASGHPLSGVGITFALDDPALASVTRTATTSADGVATAILTARDYPGEVKITATSESVSGDPPARVVILDESAPDEIRVKASPGSISVLATSSVTAEVLNAAGNPVPDGTEVTFGTDNKVYGKMSPASVTTYAGLATAVFEASDQPGFAKIIAGAGDVSGSADIEITEMPAQPAAAMINVTVSPDSVYPGETAEIYAAAYDASGHPLSGVGIMFTLNDPALASVTRTATTSADGVATVILTARDYPGEVEITAASESVSSDPPARVVILDASAPDEIRVKASPGSIPVLAASLVTAEVLNAAGNPVPDGTEVTFGTDSGVYGKMSPASVTTYAGAATAVFEASDQPGFAKVIAGAGDVSGSADIEITEAPAPPAAAMINVTAARDSVYPGETAEIYAAAYDTSGHPLSGVEITFAVNDPALAFITGTATTSARGVATAVLTAREHPGEVEITANSEFVSGDPPVRVVILDESAPDEIRVKASPASIPVLGTSSVTAEVVNAAGHPVPDGTAVTFETENGVYGKMSPASVTTYAGVATAVFEASDQPGLAEVIAVSGDVSGSADIEITEAPARPAVAMINVTAARDSVYPGETAKIYATAYDASGHPLSGVEISFTLDNPALAFITSTATTSDKGKAKAIFTARDFSGEVDVTATAESVSSDPKKIIIIEN